VTSEKGVHSSAICWLHRSKLAAAYLCAVIAIMWAILLCVGGFVVVCLGEHWVFGTNGTSVRVQWTQKPQQVDLLSWDVVSSSLEWRSTAYDAFLRLPVVPVFVVSVAAALLLWLLEHYLKRRSTARM